jgi:putative DNA primase/helicase
VTLELVPPPEDSAPEEVAPSIWDAQPRTNDLANAHACHVAIGQDYRWCLEWQEWLAWTGTHWARIGAFERLWADVARVAQYEYAACKKTLADLVKQRPQVALKFGVGSPELKAHEERIQAETALLKWHSGSQNTAKVRATIDHLKAILPVSFLSLDRDPWLINCSNGTLDLRQAAHEKNAELVPHDRAHLLTSCLEIPFERSAKAPTWEAFLRQCMANDPLLVLYLQRLVGYTLTATTDEHLLMFCYGSGANGKSTFLRVLQDLLGPYGCAMPRTLLFASKAGDVHPTELATLYGRRLGVCSEVGEDVRLDEAKMKDLTGGDPISCRRMHEDFWTYRPTHTLWLAGNHKPTIVGTDDGVWRRMHVVPWAVSFPPDKQDHQLGQKLNAELPGILAWAVAGCLEWQRLGVSDPPAVTEATAEYRDHSDPVGDYFRLHVVFEPGARMTCKALRSSYEAWCEELGHPPVGARKLGARLRSHAVKPVNLRLDGRFSNGWAGVRLLAEFEKPPEG